MAVPEDGHVVDHVEVGATIGVVQAGLPAALELRRALKVVFLNPGHVPPPQCQSSVSTRLLPNGAPIREIPLMSVVAGGGGTAANAAVIVRLL